MAIDKDLPDELRVDGEDSPENPDRARLDALGIAIAAKRKAAIDARRDSGIESVWMAAEEAYLCIDDQNRGDFKGAKWAKPVSFAGPLTKEAPKTDDTRSTAFVRMTARYVEAGSARVSEIILPVGDKAFSFGPSPVPELVAQAGDTAPLLENGRQVYRPLMEGETPDGEQVNGMVAATRGDYAKAMMQMAQEYAEKAETRVFDWLVECNYPAEARKVVFDSARIGVGVLKGPFPDSKQSKALLKGNGENRIVLSRKVKPTVRWIDAWNFFPDGACGEDIHAGEYCFERDYLTERKVKDLKKQKDNKGRPIYLAEAIDRVIKEGPNKCNTEGANPAHKPNDKQYEIWYMTGTVKRSDMRASNALGLEEGDDEDDISAIVTMINDTVVRASMNPLDSGNFPYRVKPWSRRSGHWAGVGVAEQLSMPQRMVNAATRALLNNAGLSAGVQIVIDQLKIVPADGKWTITPNKIWLTAEGQTVDDVAKAFRAIEFPNVSDALMAIIQYAFKLAEEATNIPLITQGQADNTTPDTFGAVELQDNNANTFLRSQGYSYDDCITEPLVNDMYEYLLLDPSVPDDEKGDFEINARGSIAMVEKAIQERFLNNLLAVSKDPAFELSPAKVMAEILKGKRIDARKVQLSKEEKEMLAKQEQPENPVITAAKIRSASAEKIAAGKDQVTVRKSELDTDRDVAYEQALNERAAIQEQGKTRELDLKRELEVFKENNAMKRELDKLKTQLAIAAAELKTQKELAVAANHAKQVADTSMEPVGRADAGHAFEQ